MRCLVLFVFASGSLAQAADHPSWTSLSDLLKEAKDSKTVSSFVDEHSLDEVTKGPAGSLIASDQAYSLLYRENHISTIVLRVADWPEGYGEKHWKPYSGQLPGKLSARDQRAAIIKKLGKPVKNRKYTWRLDGLYYWVHFDEEKKGIAELYVSPRVIEAAPKSTSSPD